MQAYKSLTQIVVEQLRERIFSGGAQPGTRLSIVDLAKEFKISALPVREALRNLEAEGLVEFFPNKGVVVKALSAAEVREIFLIRGPLEETAATAAVVNWDSEEKIALLESILKQMDQTADKDVWNRLHGQFHQEIYALSNYPKVMQLAGLFRGQMRIYTRLYLDTVHQRMQAQAEHHEMVACLKERDVERIRDVVNRHLERPAQIVLSALEGKNAAQLR
ncbi:MAG: GntR family transcriptional regulator [Aquisalimonadaceae bacterium]